MKIYYVSMSYFDGDHDHGQYTSPFFSNLEAAEKFLQAVKDLPEDDSRKWGTCTYGNEDPLDGMRINSYEILEEFKEIPEGTCLTITYT